MSPHNSDSEGRPDKHQDNDEDNSEDTSSSDEEYEGDDLDAAAPQSKPVTNPNNPLISEEPLVFQQRSKYFQKYQEQKEVESKSGRNSMVIAEEESVGTGGLFGSATVLDGEKPAAGAESLGSAKRKRDDGGQVNDGKGKGICQDDAEAPLHDDIDDYERELREVEDRNRKRAMRVKDD